MALQLNSPQMVEKFCKSKDQLLKSDLGRVDVTPSHFQTKKDMETLAHFLMHHKPLTDVKITLDNSEHLKILLDAVADSPNIRKLELNNGCTDLNEYNAALVRSMLQNNKSIRRLLAQHDNTKSRFIFDGISKNTSLESIKINDRIDSPIIFGDSVKKLTLVGGYKSGSDFNVEFLRDALASNKSIRYLKLIKSHLKLTSAISGNTSIKRLCVFQDSSMNNNDEDLVKFSQALKDHPALTDVSLQTSLRTVENAIMLCNAVIESKSIIKFEAHAFASSDILAVFLNQLVPSQRLTELKVRNNYSSTLPNPLEISPLTEALKHRYCSLKVLDLENATLPTDNTLSLALALEANTSLEVVNMKDTTFSDEALQVMQRWLAKSTQLKSIKFEAQHYKSCDKLDLAAIIRNNTTLETLHYYRKRKTIDDILDALSVNDTLTDLAISTSEEDFTKKIEEKITPNNWAIRNLFNADYFSYDDIIGNLTTRNKQYQSSMQLNTIIVIHNIVRDKDSFARLPREVWLIIFEKLRYPGLPNFKLTADNIFKSYNTKI